MNRLCHVRTKKELELNGLDAPHELQINTVTQQATQHNSGKSKPTCHHCKNQVTTETSAVNLNKRDTKPKTSQTVLASTITTTVFKQTLTPITKTFNVISTNNTNNRKDRKPRTVYPPSDTCGKLTFPQINVTLVQTQLTDFLPGTDDRKERIRHNKETIRLVQMTVIKLQPEF